MFYKSMFYKSMFYKSIFYKSSPVHVLQIHILQIQSSPCFANPYFTNPVQSMFYKTIFYKSSPVCFTNPVQSLFYKSSPCKCHLWYVVKGTEVKFPQNNRCQAYQRDVVHTVQYFRPPQKQDRSCVRTRSCGNLGCSGNPTGPSNVLSKYFWSRLTSSAERMPLEVTTELK